jgi:hypothetical protein
MRKRGIPAYERIDRAGYIRGGVFQFPLDGNEQRLQSLCVCQRLCGLCGRRRCCGCGHRFSVALGLHELPMQNVFAAAHRPEGHPIADRQQDHAENTYLKHGYT